MAGVSPGNARPFRGERTRQGEWLGGEGFADCVTDKRAAKHFGSLVFRNDLPVFNERREAVLCVEHADLFAVLRCGEFELRDCLLDFGDAHFVGMIWFVFARRVALLENT